MRRAGDLFQSNVDRYCPADYSSTIGTNKDPLDLETQMRKILQGLDDFARGLESKAPTIAKDLGEIRGGVSSVNSSLDAAYPFLYGSVAASAVLILIVIFMMTDAVLLWGGRTSDESRIVRCATNAVVLPAFVFFMLLAWLLATLFLLAALGGADFCVTPESNAVSFLDMIQAKAYGGMPDDDVEEEEEMHVAFSLLKFYVGGCDESVMRKAPDVDREVALFRTVVEDLHEFLLALTTDTALDAFGAFCRSPDDAFVTLNTTVTILHERLHVNYSVIMTLFGLISCRTMNPLYTRVAHEGMCINAVNGLVWIFSTQLTIAVCSMVMITLRAGAREIEEEEIEEDDTSSADKDDKQLSVEQHVLEPAA
mmetsp:Transcript_4722/g.13265  ORF Transcript_4722/g.13265 Transcript_4722/m.13265 type:complete len:367 (-) Transcript_4722:318-1418(-)